MKITISLLLLAFCVFVARVSTQPTPTASVVSEFESEVESEISESDAEESDDSLSIGGTTEPESDSNSSSSEEEDLSESEDPDGTDAPDADGTTPAPLGGIAGVVNKDTVNNAEATAGFSSGSVLGMKASDQAVQPGGFSATAVGVATTLGIVGALAAAAGIVVYIKKK